MTKGEEQISQTLEMAWESLDKGDNKFPGASYMDGVAAALDWVLRNEAPNPVTEEPD